MRALLAGQRQGSPGVVLGLLGLICLLIASIGLNLKHASDLNRLQDLIYQRCRTLSVPQNDARRVEITEWNALAEQERQDGQTTRAASYQHLADAMQAAVTAAESNPCKVYKRALAE